MDPNETLDAIRRVIKRINEGESQSDDFEGICDLFEAFDEWMSKGGFLPTDWRKSK